LLFNAIFATYIGQSQF